MKNCWDALRLFIWLTLLTGLIYPLVITGIAHLVMNDAASGSFLKVDGKVIGSRLIAQQFTGDQYFWPRPSAVAFNPLPSGGSNLGPISPVLKKIVDERREAIVQAHKLSREDNIPSELLYASGSGVDPHISPSTAYFQMQRIARARGWEMNSAQVKLKKLIDAKTQESHLRFIGPPCVCVLELNIALDAMKELSND